MLYQLSYVGRILLERVMGIEPTPSAWKAEVLPLNYTRQWSYPTYRLHCCPNLRLPLPLTHSGGGGRIRTYEGISQQIYSLPPLAAWVPLLKMSRVFCDGRHVVSIIAMRFAQLSLRFTQVSMRCAQLLPASKRPRPTETCAREGGA